jgi:hypothetical protein
MSHAIKTIQVERHLWHRSIVSLTIFTFKKLANKKKQHLHKTG